MTSLLRIRSNVKLFDDEEEKEPEKEKKENIPKTPEPVLKPEVKLNPEEPEKVLLKSFIGLWGGGDNIFTLL